MQKLLEDEGQERPAATVSQRHRFLEQFTGTSLSVSTVRRLWKRLVPSRKTPCGGDGDQTKS
jgi:hypothetical protein